MTTRATGTFEVKLVPQATTEGGDPSLGRLTIDKTFAGDIDGTSRGEMLSHRTATAGSAGYVAMERVTATVHGRAGSFVLQHSATMHRGAPSLSITVVPDSGTDALAGLRGTLNIIIEQGKHSYEFDYDLGED